MLALGGEEAAEDLGGLYAAFNSRDVERLLTLVTDDVALPDGPARTHGRDAARDC